MYSVATITLSAVVSFGFSASMVSASFLKKSKHRITNRSYIKWRVGYWGEVWFSMELVCVCVYVRLGVSTFVCLCPLAQVWSSMC